MELYIVKFENDEKRKLELKRLKVRKKISCDEIKHQLNLNVSTR